MSNLKEVQTLFHQSIQNPASDKDLLRLIKNNRLPNEVRMSVYYNNIYEGLYDVLKITYPKTIKLLQNVPLSDDRKIAINYIRKDLPRTGYIEDWGANFPKYLGQTKRLPFLRELAQFEWQEQIAFWAEDCLPLNPATAQQECATMNPEQIVFTPHPSLYLTQFTYDIPKVIHCLSRDNIPKKVHKKTTYCIQIRPEFVVHYYWVAEDAFAFLNLLCQGISLGEAYETVSQKHPVFDVKSCLAFAFSAELFTTIYEQKEVVA